MTVFTLTNSTSIRPGPQCALENLRLFTVRPIFLTSPSRKCSFSKIVWTDDTLKTEIFENSVDRWHVENGDFRKCWCRGNHEISLSEFSSTTNPYDSVDGNPVTFSECKSCYRILQRSLHEAFTSRCFIFFLRQWQIVFLSILITRKKNMICSSFVSSCSLLR